jgi:hypothetical protein
MSPTLTFDEFLSQYDSDAAAQHLAQGEEQRQEFLRRFPLDGWADMTVERYAQGHPDYKEAVTYWLQYATKSLGHVMLGDAKNGLIYFNKKKGEWITFWQYGSPEEAWTTIRAAWVQAFDLASQGRWQEIEAISTLRPAASLLVKALHIYYPDEILPITSSTHIKRFLADLGRPLPGAALDFIMLNRELLSRVRKVDAFEGWSTQKITNFLYGWDDPKAAKAAKKAATAETPSHPMIEEHEAGSLFAEIQAALEWKGQVILYGPPGTGKTYQARRFAVSWLLREQGDDNAAQVLEDPAEFLRAENRLSTASTSSRVWWMVANPSHWAWKTLFDEGRVSYSYGRIKKHYSQVQVGDLVVGYQGTPDKRIVALASIKRGFSMEGDEPAIELAPLMRVENGLTYEELAADPILGTCEPIRNRNQGTLFSLTESEATYLLSLLAERDPKIQSHIDETKPGTGIGQLTTLTFHPSYSYEDFIEGFRPVDTGDAGLSLALTDGVLKQVCIEAQARPTEKFAVLIDEINRANVAKVFGEIITLLERDKRGMVVTLPQSRDAFMIPPNVYFIATMNTADRSIKLLDVALRRRFAFVELLPDLSEDSPLFEQAIEGSGLTLDGFLRGLNEAIARQEGREKQIGHSFFIRDGEPIADAEGFARVFRQEVLPLLQEYCYDDYTTLATYLGDTLVDAESQTINSEALADPHQLVKALADRFLASDEAE